jgi:hypothetical protein
MALIRASDLRNLLSQVPEDAVLFLEIDEESGKINVGVMSDEPQSCETGGCGSCETPCSENSDD